MNQNLLNNFLLGVPMMIACLFLQALLISTAINYYKRKRLALTSRSFWATTGVITGVMMLLTMGNLAQVAVWALLFRLLGEFPQFGDAFYHSAVNFATLGYGDIVMSARHRLLGPLEAINGALMIGASTATLIITFQDSMQKSLHGERDART
ncbi:MAG TPA: potassium channel family protein [Burkholderiaceae bacterium]|nr:potassium channel family protein [Burkholderiaceae bacterium]